MKQSKPWLIVKNAKWGAVIIASGALAYMTYKASQGAQKITTAIDETVNAVNPVNDDNVINRGVTTIVENTTDGKYSGGGALGEWLFCVFNSNSVNCKDENEYVMPDSETLKQSIGAG